MKVTNTYSRNNSINTQEKHNILFIKEFFYLITHRTYHETYLLDKTKGLKMPFFL